MSLDRTVVSFFVLFLFVYFLESIGGFFMTSAIVSIEKQFGIPSKVSGMMVSASDFGYIPTVVFVAYLGGKGNRAKWIGGGCMLIAVANVIISSSNFLFPVEQIALNNSEFENSVERDPHRWENLRLISEVPFELRGNLSNAREFFEYCDSQWEKNISSAVCSRVDQILHRERPATLKEVEELRVMSATSFAFCDRALNRLRRMIETIRCTRDGSSAGPTATIFMGLLLLGVGRTMPFSLGLPLIDDNVKKSNLPIYFAGMFFIRLLGPVLGLMMGSVFNKFYYTFEPPRGLTPRDPMWIGCWWAGFLFLGILLFGPSLGLYCFKAPKHHQEEEEEEEKKDEKTEELIGGEKKKPKGRRLALVDRHLERTEDGKPKAPETVAAKVADFASTIRTVIRQPIYCGILIGRIIDVMAFKGFFIFLPKYLEIQFGVPQFKVNFYMGLIGVIGFAVGVMIGSFSMKLPNFDGRRVAGFVGLCSAIAACLSFVNAGIGCESTLTALGKLPNYGLNVSECAKNCFCEGMPIYPVCNIDGQVFHSPCHAGCSMPNVSAFIALDPKATPQFEGCQCVPKNVDPRQRVSRDFCREGDCNRKVKFYFGFMAMTGVFGGMATTPGMLIMLRSVPPAHRSISLGFSGFLVSLLATLPSPIFWGAIYDSFCVRWEEKCDGRGSCSLYATDSLRVWMHCVYGSLRLVALLADLFVFYHAKNLRINGEEEEETKEDNQKPENPQEPIETAENRKPSRTHKRSASREIRSLLEEEENEIPEAISSLTSNGVV